MKTADWYFDFISPYAYLQFHQIDRLPKDVEVHYRPTDPASSGLVPGFFVVTA